MRKASGIAFTLFVVWIQLAVGTASAGALPRGEPGTAEAGALPRVVPNDNRTSAGRLEDGVFRLDLVARLAEWRPDYDTHQILAFAEEGGPARIPGPLIRVREGTEVHIRVRNDVPGQFFVGQPPPRYQSEGTLSSATDVLTIHGLRAGTSDDDVLRVPRGETRELRFQASRPGTYFYRAETTERDTMRAWTGRDAQLAGAIVVDPGDQAVDPDERIFVITMTDAYPDAKLAVPGEDLFEPVINGLSWPHTERLHYQTNKTVRWRWINASGFNHPMHLHGAHFRVLATGDGVTEAMVPLGQVREVVTELAEPGDTFRMAWEPPRAGNWMMHCHFVEHVIPSDLDPHDHHDDDPEHHPFKVMAGLVMGITVTEPATEAFSPTQAKADYRLTAREAVSQGGNKVRAFSVDGPGAQGSVGLSVPGQPIVISRGRKATIEVVNQLTEPTSVHWHGMELESYYDGIPGWSRTGRHIAPLLATGERFLAEMTPPRAGTFMYHSHMDHTDQLPSGMYGPLIVLEPGENWNPELDRILILGGTADDWLTLNGITEGSTSSWQAGTTYRVRIINIHPEATVDLTLSGSRVVSWQRLAKDGADLPAALRREQPASLRIGVGETYDFLYTPKAPGELRLEVRAPYPTQPGEARFAHRWMIQ